MPNASLRWSSGAQSVSEETRFVKISIRKQLVAPCAEDHTGPLSEGELDERRSQTTAQ